MVSGIMSQRGDSMTCGELLKLFIDRYPIFHGTCGDFRPGDKENSIVLYLETGDELEVLYNADTDKFHYTGDLEETMNLHERLIDFKVYKALDYLYDISSLYGCCSTWDKADNVGRAIATFQEKHETGYTQDL